ncbi:MAG: RDD family protein [Anaerolineaceae bacterium]|nr:RDD family protein [Anaerolineaceae bacterium]
MLPQKPSYAKLTARMIAFALDYIFIAGYLIFVVAIGVALNTFFPAVTNRLFSNPLSGQMTGFLILTLPVSLYFVLFESSAEQATWGKRKRGLQVTRTDGSRLSFLRAASRTLLKFIPWELAHTCIWQISFAQQEPSPIITLGFVLVWILIGANIVSLWISPTKQTLYDRLAGTHVVVSRVLHYEVKEMR